MRRQADAAPVQALAPLGAGEADFAVAVLPDATHGQLVRVTLRTADGTRHAAQADAVHAALGPLTLRHEVA